MRVNSISAMYQPKCIKRNLKEETTQTKPQPIQNVNFKGIEGKLAGGTLGACIAGAIALAATAATGPVAALIMLASEAGGAIVGGKIGDEIEEF